MELDHFGGLFTAGFTLTLEERAALELQMAKKQMDERLHRCAGSLALAGAPTNSLHIPPNPRTSALFLPSMRFWGRVTGTTGDYLVVLGVLSTAEFPARKWFYATSKELALQQMPELSPEFAAAAAALARTRFVGNPAKLLGADAGAAEEEEELDEQGNPKPRTPRFSEAHRLAALVAGVEAACGVVPRGAYAVTATRHVVPNAAFGGVSASEATNLAAWAHFRPAQHPSRASALTRAAAVPGSDDFLDSLAEDEPAGVWAAQLDAGKGVARVASLQWPGYFAFATVDGSAKWGSVYVGDGRAEEVHILL